MKIRTVSALAVSSFLFAACQSHWTKPGATPEQLSADTAECEQLASELYPVSLATADTSNREAYHANCPSAEHQISCSSGGDLGGLRQYDQNEEQRKQATARCMEWKGYSR